jgi:hypothetical protein
MKYTVMVDDNFNYMDESERHVAATLDSAEKAVAVARSIVDEFLADNHRAGMSSDDLYSAYKSFGEDPFIISDDPDCNFSAWSYAKARCLELCAGPQAE